MSLYTEFIASIPERVKHFEELGLPVVFYYTGDRYEPFVLSILNEYVDTFSLYVAKLPCYDESYFENLQASLETQYPALNPIYVDCGKKCCPLDESGNLANLWEYPYRAGCSVASEKIRTDISGEYVNIVPGIYDYSEIKDCKQYKHLIPDELGLCSPNPEEHRWACDRIHNDYILYPNNKKQIEAIITERGFKIDSHECQDMVDRNDCMNWFYLHYPRYTLDDANQKYQNMKLGGEL